MFICISGLTVDGHDFASGAEKSGAAAIICEKEVHGITIPAIKVKNSRIAFSQIAANFYKNPARHIKLIGVTGTNGKTTVTYLIKAILDYAGYKTGLIGTTHNIIGGKLLSATLTTPDPLEFHQLLNEMRKEKCEYAIMEVSSHSLALDKLYGCTFEVAAFTNLTQDHLDFHKTMQDYFKAKTKLFEISKKSAVNIDDAYGLKLFSQINHSALSFGTNKNAHVRAENINLKANGISFLCSSGGDSAEIVLNIPGGFLVYNALAAISVCLQLGLSLEQIAKGLSLAKGVKGRVEVVPTGRNFTVLIDYAHTPDALENVLDAIRQFAKGRVVLLFGCGGDRDRAKRPIMGKIAIEKADFVIITSDNPRTEPPMQIIDDILTGIRGRKDKYIVIENRFEAIKYAINKAQKNDIILLAGKGHETYQILSDKTINFDERKVVKMCLNS